MAREMVEKVKGRVRDVPENIKAAVDDLKNKSVADAVTEIPRRFGRSNRKLKP